MAKAAITTVKRARIASCVWWKIGRVRKLGFELLPFSWTEKSDTD
ncbi:hypothetical protein ACQX25_11330 [Corynebacterium diphtheriae]|nr:hypothetical protein [Corynebacterium diphtheriae]MDZ5308433.1 hypothetical protein [Corynebacterium diphtheriae]